MKIKELNSTASIKEVVEFISKNYKEVTGKYRGGEDPKYNIEVTKIIENYKFNKKEFYKIWDEFNKFYTA